MKHTYDIKQLGENPDFPKEAYIWTPSQPIPEWLSDQAKIDHLNPENGEPVLEKRPKSSGGFDLLKSSGEGVLVSLEGESSVVLFSSTHPLISLTPHQLELLYEIYLRD